MLGCYQNKNACIIRSLITHVSQLYYVFEIFYAYSKIWYGRKSMILGLSYYKNERKFTILC